MLHRSYSSTCEPRPSGRRGVVLLAVLVVLSLLALAGYSYVELAMAEGQAQDNYHRIAKVKAVADSGVHYAAALLSSADHMESLLGNNPYDNAEMFRNIPIMGEDGRIMGYFELLAPIDPEDSDGGKSRPGVVDESGKINPNALMKKDPTGEDLLGLLTKLPNMTPELAACIVDYLDPDRETRTTGAEDDYYSGQTPPYRAKNGPLDTLDEMLLIKGVTEELLYGDDLNRNGIQDAGEGTDGEFSRGWSAFLTIHSREQNLSSKGTALLDLMDKDAKYATVDEYLEALLATGMGEDMAKFIVLIREKGPDGGNRSVLSGLFQLIMPGATKGKTSNAPPPVPGNLSDYAPDGTKKPGSKQIKSLFELVEATVTISSSDPKKPGSVIYTSPLKDKTVRREILPILFDSVTVFADTDIPARINVNTAPKEVLETLQDITPGDVDLIIANRPKYAYSAPADPIYQTPAWLVTETNIKISTLQNAEKFITTRSQVYKVQVRAYLEENKGPAARVEAVIDTNGGRPRIIAWRDLSELGRTVRTEP